MHFKTVPQLSNHNYTELMSDLSYFLQQIFAAFCTQLFIHFLSVWSSTIHILTVVTFRIHCMKITSWVCSFGSPCTAFSDVKTPGNNCKCNLPFKGRSIAFIFCMIRKGSSSSWLLIRNKDIAFFNPAIFNFECSF